MKLCKRLIPALLAVLMLSTTVLAAGRIDLDREAALTISYQDGSAPLSGAEFRIYLVASVDETGELTPTDDFDSFQVDIRGKNVRHGERLPPRWRDMSFGTASLRQTAGGRIRTGSCTSRRTAGN